MQIEITKKSATTFMRWVIVLTLFGTVIYQNNKIDALQQRVDLWQSMYHTTHDDWTELGREYAELSKSCPK
jgi:hypothetical protein